MFILSEKAIQAIIDSPALQGKLCEGLDVSPSTIYRLYSGNAQNSDLTKHVSLVILQQETGLEVDEILVELNSQSLHKETIS